jgi:hypothetical protein
MSWLISVNCHNTRFVYFQKKQNMEDQHIPTAVTGILTEQPSKSIPTHLRGSNSNGFTLVKIQVEHNTHIEKRSKRFKRVENTCLGLYITRTSNHTFVGGCTNLVHQSYRRKMSPGFVSVVPEIINHKIILLKRCINWNASKKQFKDQIDPLAKSSQCLTAKWMLLESAENIDSIWFPLPKMYTKDLWEVLVRCHLAKRDSTILYVSILLTIKTEWM